jgi:hypothetical protein
MVTGRVNTKKLQSNEDVEYSLVQPGSFDFEIIKLEDDESGPVWPEWDEEGEKDKVDENFLLSKNMFIDFKKVKKISLKDPIAKTLIFGDIYKMFIMDAHEAMLYSDSTWDYIRYAYSKLYGLFPDTVRIEGLKARKFIMKLFEMYKIESKSYHKTTSKLQKDKTLLLNFVLCLDDILLYFDGGDSVTLFYNKIYEKQLDSKLHLLLGLMKNFKEPVVAKNKIYVVYRNDQGFTKMGFNVKKVNVNILENYNDDFKSISDSIIKDLNNKQKTGLFILSGIPGTGKTSFIRYLTSKIKRDIIFISPDMVDQITDPSFIPFLMKNNDSVLIIEDAEPALHKRGGGGRTSAVSNILNLTDGLLSDCLNISIVCTFNTTSKDIDDALLRKGRLMMNYHFDKLNVEKSIALLNKLGYENIVVDEPMTLADIYYYEKENNPEIKKTKKIGFGN